MSTEVERTNGAEGSELPTGLGQTLGDSTTQAGKHRPVLKTLRFELEALTLTMTFEAVLDRDGDGDPQIGPPVG